MIQSLLETPRHEFVPLKYRRHAYFDMSLPIGFGQTISSPFIVAYMTEALAPQPTDRVLEIGTGSGYQAAILSPLVNEVYTIEIVDELAGRAKKTLHRLGYKNVHVKAGDGYQGWPEHAPFDKIIVTCSPERVPEPLVRQIRDGGRMIIPVGERYQQTLYLLKKRQGEMVTESLRPTLFVPMTGTADIERSESDVPATPQVVNGTFEAKPGGNDLIPGWYYQRQLRWEADDRAPEGSHFVTFHNRESGRTSRALQGFSVDGMRVRSLKLSAWIKYEEVTSESALESLPMLAVTFYDQQRREVGLAWIGPWSGTRSWHRVNGVVSVPRRAREGILRMGLFGATGQISFDDVQIQAIGR